MARCIYTCLIMMHRNQPVYIGISLPTNNTIQMKNKNIFCPLSHILIVTIIGIFFVACNGTPSTSVVDIPIVKGCFFNQSFIETSYEKGIEQSPAVYCVQMTFNGKDSVSVDYGFEGAYTLACTRNGDTIFLKKCFAR